MRLTRVDTLLSPGHLHMNIPPVGLNKKIVVDSALDSPECQPKDKPYYVF